MSNDPQQTPSTDRAAEPAGSETLPQPLSDIPSADAAVAWAMVEASPDALVMVDESGIIQLINRQTEALFGYGRIDLLGRPVETLLPERFAAVHTAHRTRYRVAPEVRAMGGDLALRAQRADGTEFPVEVSLSPMEMAGELRVIAAVRDISSRVEADAEARQIRAGIDATHDGVFMFTPETLRFTYVNQGAVDQTGYRPDELLGMSPLHIAPEFTRSTLLGLLAPLLAGDVNRLAYQTLHRRKDGVDVPVEINLEYLSETDNNPTGLLVAVVRDITERVQIEATRHRQQALTAALSQVRAAMLRGASRTEGLTHICGAAADALVASIALVLTSTDESDELTVEAATNLDDHAETAVRFDKTSGIIAEVFITGEPQVVKTGDARINRTNQTVMDQLRIGSVIVAPLLRNDEVSGVLLIARHADHASQFSPADLSGLEQFASEAALAIELAARRESQRRVELYEDRERIGRDMHDNVIGRLFATGMSIQATLTQISDPTTKDRLEHWVEDIDDAIKEIRTTIYGLRSLVDWGKATRGEILAIAAEQTQALGFEPNVELSGPIDDIDPAVADQLVATLREALTNTVKYAGARTVSLEVAATSNEVALTVTDDGIGFESNADHRSDGHTGNGLRNIVAGAETLGGHAAVTTTPGSGTTITWVVPLG